MKIRNTDMLLQLTRQKTSLVMIDRDDHPSVTCHRVLTDDEQVGTVATAHLLDVGRRAIAHIAGPAIVHAKRREKAWREAHIALGDLLRVPLTTVGWSRRDQGRQAAELLLGSLQGDVDRPQRVVMPPRLIVRESSGRG